MLSTREPDFDKRTFLRVAIEFLSYGFAVGLALAGLSYLLLRMPLVLQSLIYLGFFVAALALVLIIVAAILITIPGKDETKKTNLT